MSPGELAAAAAEAIGRGVKNFPIVLPRKATGARKMVVFNKPRLYGEVACENSDGRTVVYVEAIKILAWLAAAGLIRVDAELNQSDPKTPSDASCADQPAASKHVDGREATK